eukprot:CAMPEP_0196704582 /NCGR_PEP_ID=MMETSP1090-20130531/58210_1 /TAXON_ID=37098 /ORGANISM="Isochrysis sp, Strain CCMP1244" /LENGTH=31 /DNA_ID= /DNA_START= /DNA_END= /DNA_ORIENTATION=
MTCIEWRMRRRSLACSVSTSSPASSSTATPP